MGNNTWNNQNQPEGWDPNQQEGGRPDQNQPEGWDPNQQQQGGQPDQNQPEGWDPNQQQAWDPNQQQQSQSWDPNQQQGWNPNQQQGWNPNQQQGWNPNQQQGWNPNQQQGWNPNQQQAWDPNQQQAWNSGPQAGYQQGGDQPQQTQYDPATQGWDPTMSAYGAYGAPAAPLASWGKRALGWLVDYLVPSMVIGVITSAIFPQDVNTTTTGNPLDYASSGAASWLQLVLSLAVYAGLAYLASKDGQTPGRRLAKTQLLGEDMKPLSVGRGFLRYIAHYIDSLICLIGWLFPLWDKERQTIADKLMKSKVYDISQTGPVNRA